MKGGADKGVAGDQSKLIQRFVELTEVDPAEAFERIYGASGNIRVALEKYFSEMAQQETDARMAQERADAKMAQLLSDEELARQLDMENRGSGGAAGAARAPGKPGGAAKAARAPTGAAQLLLDNRNMLEVSYEQHNSGEIVGYLIAGNAGIVGGGLMDKSRKPDADPHWNIDCSDTKRGDLPQEEGSFINFCCATRDYKRGNKYFFDQMKAADRVWGMKNLTGTDNSTKQGVDYTKGINHKYKYERCIYVGNMFGYSQKGLGRTLEEWNTRELFPCKVFITAGPQARNPDTEFRPPKSLISTMRRTYDAQANIHNDYLINCITAAYVGSLREMDSQGVTAAIVPGLSTGVYAPKKKQDFIKRAIPQIIAEAITAVPLTNIKKVIYCHPDN